jgi:PAS domain S-box-containing protein
MCLDLYPQFLNSEYFERLKTKGGGRDAYKAQQKYKELASKKLESPLQWLLRFAEIAERVYECICISDPTLPDCPVVYVNKAFHTCTGYERSEVLGRNCRFLQGPRTTVETKSQLREDIASGEDTKCKILNYRKNGEHFYNLLSMKSVVIKGQTKPRFIIAIQFDLSFRRSPLELFQLETVS